jgi:hypothetical protein
VGCAFAASESATRPLTVPARTSIGADLLADLRDAVGFAGALHECLLDRVAVHRARLIRADHAERGALAERCTEPRRDAGQARATCAVLDHRDLALRIGFRVNHTGK